MSQTNSELIKKNPQPEDASQPTQGAAGSAVQGIVRRVPQGPRYMPPHVRARLASRIQQQPPSEPSSSQELIPRQLMSRATIEHIGFTFAAATRMWDAWVNWPSGLIRREIDPDDGRADISFRIYILRHIIYSEDATYEEMDDWRRCMDAYGLNKGTQDSLLSYVSKNPHRPHWDCSRYSVTLVNLRYLELETLNKACISVLSSPTRNSHQPWTHLQGHKDYSPWNPELLASVKDGGVSEDRGGRA